MHRPIDSETRVRPSRFAHFVLRVRDLDRSIAWYRSLVGMEVVHRAETLAFLTYDDEHHRMALVETPVEAPAAPNAPGLDHVADPIEELFDQGSA